MLEKFPQDFSLKGYEKYPNSNSVLLHLMNKKWSLLKNGWITKKQAKIYSISDTGVTHVESRLKKAIHHLIRQTKLKYRVKC